MMIEPGHFTVDELLAATGAPMSVRWEIGSASFDELMSLYADAGFLYPAKMAVLAPHLPAVRDSWERTLRAGTELHWTANARSEDMYLEASLSTWRSTLNGWVGQHLASRGRPRLSGAVLLLAQRTMIDLGESGSHQYWFQPSNKFANRTFGSAARTLPAALTGLRDTVLCTMPPGPPESSSSGVRVTECGPHDRELAEFARIAGGDAFAVAEDIADGDTCLEGIDEVYRRVGLARQRRVWLAFLAGTAEPVAALLAYRGPVGLSFSFLENRSEILMAPWLDKAQTAVITRALAGVATRAWMTVSPVLSPAVRPLVVPPQSVPAVESLGGLQVRGYRQVICLRDGFTGWYEHMARFYERIARRDTASACLALAGPGHTHLGPAHAHLAGASS
jgi:hypothetical protein